MFYILVLCAQEFTQMHKEAILLRSTDQPKIQGHWDRCINIKISATTSKLLLSARGGNSIIDFFFFFFFGGGCKYLCVCVCVAGQGKETKLGVKCMKVQEIMQFYAMHAKHKK